jgi:hypothetical protein
MIKVHKIIGGPFEQVDDDGDTYWFIDVYVESKGEFFDLSLSTDEFDKVYDIVKHMKSATIEPYIIGSEDERAGL